MSFDMDPLPFQPELPTTLATRKILKLIPIPSAPEPTNLPVLTLSGGEGGRTLALGRGEHSTGIKDPSLSRKLAEIVLEVDGQFYCEMKKTAHLVHFNGEPVSAEKFAVHDGDVLCLLNEKYAYNIRVEELTTVVNNSHFPNGIICKQEEEQETGDLPAELDKMEKHAKKQMAEEVTCPICIEVMVHAILCSPCGHIFCRECIKAVQGCPSCRAMILYRTPLAPLDNMIASMAVRGDFDPDDEIQYVMKAGASITEGQRALMRKRNPGIPAALPAPLVDQKSSRKRKRPVARHQPVPRPPPPPPPPRPLQIHAGPPPLFVNLSMFRPATRGAGSTSESAICID